MMSGHAASCLSSIDAAGYCFDQESGKGNGGQAQCALIGSLSEDVRPSAVNRFTLATQALVFSLREKSPSIYRVKNFK